MITGFFCYLVTKFSQPQVLVVSGQKGLMKERMKLLNMLWKADISAEMLYKANPKLLSQFQHAENEGELLLLVCETLFMC